MRGFCSQRDAAGERLCPAVEASGSMLRYHLLNRTEREKKCLYFGLLSPGVARLLMPQHEHCSRSKGISCFWIYFSFLTLLLCSMVHDRVTQRMSAGGDYRTCAAVCSGLKPFQVHCGIFDQLILRTIHLEQLCCTRSCL